MRYRKKLWSLSIGTLAMLGLGYFLTSFESALCDGSVGCRTLLDYFGDQSIFILLPILVTLVVLFFLPENISKAWYKFAIIFVPVSVVLIILASPARGGITGVLPSDRELVMLGLGVIYLLTSLSIILYQVIKGKKSQGIDK